MDICPFHQVTGYLHGFKARLYAKTVICQFNDIESRLPAHLLVGPVPEAAPVEILPAVSVLKVIGVDGIADSGVLHPDQHAQILEWTGRRIGDSHTGSAAVMVSPDTHGVIENIFPVYAVDVRSPKDALGFPGGAAFSRESCADLLPIHKIGTAIDWNLVCGFSDPVPCGIDIEKTIIGTIVHNRGVRTVVVDHRIGVCHGLLSASGHEDNGNDQ